MSNLTNIKVFLIVLITTQVVVDRVDAYRKKRYPPNYYPPDNNYPQGEHYYPQPEHKPGGYYPGYPEPEGTFPTGPWTPVTFPPTQPPQSTTTTQATTTTRATTSTTRQPTTPPPGNQCCCDCMCDCTSTNTTIPSQCPICMPSGMGKRSLDRVERQTLFVDCFTAIRAVANADTGTLLGLLLTTLLSNLVIPILQTVLAGNNTLEGAVLPLTNILCYIVGLLLLVLRSLGLLGLLGMNGLLQNILGGLG